MTPILEGSVHIEYHFRFPDGRTESCHVDLDAEGPTINGRQRPESPLHWTALDYRQCGHCPLQKSEHPDCPPASKLALISEPFADRKSFEEVTVEVQTAQRSYHKTLPLQEGLFGLFGLIMATSGCPHLSFLAPMARYHLPFSTLEETIVRSTSLYLLGQYFVAQRGGEPDFELEKFGAQYAEVRQVNLDFAERLRHIAKGDAGINSVVILDAYAQLLSAELSTGLTELDQLWR